MGHQGGYGRLCSLRGCRWLLGLLALSSGWAQADLSIVGTRFIYPAGKPAISIRVGNSGRAPILLQAWLDKGDAEVDPSALVVPFVLSPPISRLEPRQNAALVLRYSGEPLPGDRESVFWINFLEVPPLAAAKDDLLRLASRMRMKLLYRPQGLSGKADEAVRQLRWSLVAAGRAARRCWPATRPRTTCPSLRWRWAAAIDQSHCRGSPWSPSARRGSPCPICRELPRIRRWFITKWQLTAGRR